MRKHILYKSWAAAAALSFACGAAIARDPASSTGAGLLDATCEVVGISDGDTFKARCPYEQIRVRFAGIDAPESGQAFGRVAKQYLAQLIFRKHVRVAQSKATRSYGRIVANVYDERGQDVGLMMVGAGLAWHYKRFAREQTPSARLAYMRAEEVARAQTLGLWADPHAQPPWEWRHRAKAQ